MSGLNSHEQNKEDHQMQIDEYNFDITTYQYDYGIPIVFEARLEDGFSMGDELIVAFNDKRIKDREGNIIDSDNYSFDFALTKSEADSVFDYGVKNQMPIPYTVKRYRNGQFLETLVNANIIFRGTVKWEE